jgi:hypothetical protein
MIKYALTAAVAALALGAPAAVHAQTVPQPMPQPAPGMSTNVNATITGTITGQPQPGPNDFAGYGQPYVAPMPGPYARPLTPRTTWIPAHNDWDANTGNYTWVEGQYVEAPRENAQWVPGRWVQTPTSWIWLDGRWN